MTGIADMAHHHANGTDTGCLGNQPSGAGRRQQHGRRTGRVITQCPNRLLLPEAVNHVSAVKRAGGLPARTVNVQQYAPHLAICHCLLKTGDNAVIASHSGKWPHPPQPVHQRAGHRQYRNTVHHPVNTGRSFTSGHVLVRFSQHPGSIKLYLLLRYRKTCCPHLAPERAKENPRIGGLQKQRFIECCCNNV